MRPPCDCCVVENDELASCNILGRKHKAAARRYLYLPPTAAGSAHSHRISDENSAGRPPLLADSSKAFKTLSLASCTKTLVVAVLCARRGHILDIVKNTCEARKNDGRNAAHLRRKRPRPDDDDDAPRGARLLERRAPLPRGLTHETPGARAPQGQLAPEGDLRRAAAERLGDRYLGAAGASPPRPHRAPSTCPARARRRRCGRRRARVASAGRAAEEQPACETSSEPSGRGAGSRRRPPVVQPTVFQGAVVHDSGSARRRGRGR